MEQIAHIWDALEPYLSAEGLELDDLELKGSGRGRTLRVVIDSAGGVDVERIAEVSRRLARLLAGVIDGEYTLEVSSPGLERPLKRPEHYVKSIGREVVVKAREEDGKVVVHRGRLAEVTPTELVLEEGPETVVIEMQSVTSARTVYRIRPAPKPGKRPVGGTR